ncbi:RHS repeat-associated core domain-containing protein [Pseudomonas sp. KFB-139]|uniref:RHS repeat-associated core domain-containing protein n=1 Tax=Pseudomonas serbiensis TaxID=3064350 RepID=A0ABT9CY40_9PSED|nr:RHS repeat-associated core domain-containing protein [Pseudomonas sp. KFB-138]MDO7928760.1 RHS repeat-associated core domain-containing protein [Pseudomonas sp. KFB-138]
MNSRSAALYRHTPELQRMDPRGLPLAAVAFCRRDAAEEPQVRVHRNSFNAAGRAALQWDPRLWADQAPANLAMTYSLSGRMLACDSVDAGWRLVLPGDAGQAVESWDGRGTVSRIVHDLLLRPIAVSEGSLCVQRFSYGGPDSADQNLCGQLIRHDDPAGTWLNSEFGLNGAVIERTQHFLKDFTGPDWPESLSERDALLEPGSGATTGWSYNPLGEVIRQTDAQGNAHALAHSVAGQLKESHLQLQGKPSQVIVSDIHYDAQERAESEVAGNGVISTAQYQDEDGRLVQLSSRRSNGQVLQELTYNYDPVGNVIHIEDRAQPIRYFANQRIEPVSTYQYDTLYQLTEATGRELATVNHGPVFADFQSPADPAQLANYTQTYGYDAGGNLQQLTHVGSQNHSRTLVTALHSNRSLPVINNQPPSEEDIAAAFDDNGNLLALQAGQTLSWDLRNQLQEVKPVVRESGVDDSERYIYDASGQRLRKVRTTQAKAVTHIAEVRYLPGLEIRTDTATGETLQVITAQAGRNGVRVLHWQAGKPAELTNDQYRYSLTDHLGSSTLELDKDAQIISQESYYPFGGTSWWADRDSIEANYKTVRYSGKERDATGLYYYGLRYYAPWLQRWINPDPAGVVDGLNLFRFVRNSPLRYTDSEGADPRDVIVAKGFSNFTPLQQAKLKDALDVSAKLLRRTIAELGKSRPEHGVSKAFAATYGRDLPPELKKLTVAGVRKELIEQKKFLSSILKPKIAKSLELFDTDTDILATTLMTNKVFSKFLRMRISRTHLESHNVLNVAHTLIHEASHAVSGALDAFYNEEFILPDKVSPVVVKQWSKEIRKTLKYIVLNGPEAHEFAPSDYRDAMLALDDNADIRARRTEAFGDPKIRASLLRMNADTYAGLVMSSRLPARLMAKRVRSEMRQEAKRQRVA